MRRRQQVALTDPSLRAQVFEVDPDRFGSTCGHVSHVQIWQRAGEGFNDHVCGNHNRIVLRPRKYLHGMGGRITGDALKAHQIVDEQPCANAILIRQLTRQSPRHADVAEVIDDPAKDIAGKSRLIRQWLQAGFLEQRLGSTEGRVVRKCTGAWSCTHASEMLRERGHRCIRLRREPGQ